MSVVPSKNQEKIAWYRNHIDLWTTNATAIGLVSGDVTAISSLVTAADNAYDAQQVAQTAAKAATDAYHQAVTALANAGSEVIKKIRVKAGASGEGVYPLAGIPAPATPAPTPPPATPTDLVVTLNGNGALLLKWKCKNPAGSRGTVYQVWRRIGGGGVVGEWAYVGGVGQKEFMDTTLPAGATQVTYQIQAVRSTGVGMWAEFNVNFGSNVGPAVAPVVTEAVATKKAA